MRVKSIGSGGEKIDELPNIVVLIGPNNAGKSQTLRDVQDVGGKTRKAAVDVEYSELAETVEGLFRDKFSIDLSDYEGETNIPLSGLGSNLTSAGPARVNLNQVKSQLTNQRVHQSISDYYFARLDSASRLKIVHDVESHDSGREAPKSLLHALYDDDSLAPALTDAFYEAFGLNLSLDYSSLKRMTLRVGHDFSHIPSDTKKSRSELQKMETLASQGDGYRSYAGIVLGCLYAKDRVVLLDEPEAFLHPIQANRLGSWLRSNFTGSQQQLFVATHSHSMLRGLLEGENREDCAVVRVNRSELSTTFKRIDPVDLELLTSDPLLMSARVLESLFAQGVVLCEGDSDRAIYSQVAAGIEKVQGIHFTNSLNKQSAVKILRLLDRCNVPASAILDFDLMSVSAELKSACTGALNSSDLERLMEIRQLLEEELPDPCDASGYIQLIRRSIGEARELEEDLVAIRARLRRLREQGSNWVGPKHEGVFCFDLEMRSYVDEAIEILKRSGIWLVRGGNLESFFPNLHVRKKRLVSTVLDSFDSNVSCDLHRFVSEVCIGALNRGQD